MRSQVQVLVGDSVIHKAYLAFHGSSRFGYFYAPHSLRHIAEGDISWINALINLISNSN